MPLPLKKILFIENIHSTSFNQLTILGHICQFQILFGNKFFDFILNVLHESFEGFYREITRGSIMCRCLTTNDMVYDQMKQFVQQYENHIKSIFLHLKFKKLRPPRSGMPCLDGSKGMFYSNFIPALSFDNIFLVTSKEKSK